MGVKRGEVPLSKLPPSLNKGFAFLVPLASNFNQEAFLTHYHKRSNVESVFSMIKAKFGASVRAKTPTAQVNEVLCKVLCHNICCLIQSIYELGLEPAFWTFEAKEPVAPKVLENVDF